MDLNLDCDKIASKANFALYPRYNILCRHHQLCTCQQSFYTIVYLVLEVSDADLLLLQLVVGPGDDLALHDGGVVAVELGQQGQGVGPHQLPDQGQGQRLVTLHDIRT